MKFIHLSDLHIGKRVHEFSMLEDQEYILKQILSIIDDQKPDCILIAGDIYDKTVPSAEAVQLFDSFLDRLSKRKLQAFIISGNHDSAERVAFGADLMTASGIHISPVYDGHIKPVTLQDEYGNIRIYLLPFIKPAQVRRYYPEASIESYTDALRTVIEDMHIDTAGRNILVTHQFVTGAVRCDSEEISVGGSDNVDSSVFESFDYTALGHIHSPQNAGAENIRYCGTPLKYSFSEVKHKKSVSVVTLTEKGNLSVETVLLHPLRDMKEIKGNYMQITARDFYKDMNPKDYLHITLTDEEDIPNAAANLRVIYPNLMKLDYDNTRTKFNQTVKEMEDIDTKSPIDLFSSLYELQNNQAMSSEQYDFVNSLICSIWEENE